MSMVPVSLRIRSPSLASRLLPLSSVRHLQDGRLAVVVVAPGLTQRVGNVNVRGALTRNTEDKDLF